MNYAIVFMAFILFVAMVWWFIHGKHVFTGPIVQADFDTPSNGSGGHVPAAVLEKRRGSESLGSQEKKELHA